MGAVIVKLGNHAPARVLVGCYPMLLPFVLRQSKKQEYIGGAVAMGFDWKLRFRQ